MLSNSEFPSNSQEYRRTRRQSLVNLLDTDIFNTGKRPDRSGAESGGNHLFPIVVIDAQYIPINKRNSTRDPFILESVIPDDE